MFAFETPLRRTVSLVEARVKNDSSSNPLKDLEFLSDHYAKKNEWHKANAATRHMLAIAEGATDSKFETTPLDIELQLNSKFLNAKKVERFMNALCVVSIVCGLILIVGVRLKEDPKLALDLRTQIFGADPQGFVDRAEYFCSQGKLREALADIDKALALNPKFSIALLRKSFYLYLQGHYVESLAVNELGDHSQQFYLWNKWRGESALKKYGAAASTLQAADATADTNYEVALTAARGGDYDKALKIAKLISINAQNPHDKAEGLSQEARYLVKLSRFDEAIEAATKCINGADNYYYNARAYVYRAEANYHLCRYADAVADASASIATETFNYRAYTIRAKCFEKLGREIDAQADWNNADFERSSLDL